MRAKSLQLCLTLYDAMNHRSPGPSVHGILQAPSPPVYVILSMGFSAPSPPPTKRKLKCNEEILITLSYFFFPPMKIP